MPPYSDCSALAYWRTELDSQTLSTKNLEVGISGHSIAACDDITLEPGQVLVLIGKNGSGKSTFLRTLAGFLKPIKGEVLFGSDKHVETEKLIAWLSQEEHLEFAWTVREYVSLGRIAHNSGLVLTPQDENVVDEALNQADANNLSERFMNELSGGERQRVRLARALAQETPIILMDEPTTHLDIEHQIQILLLIRKLAAQGKTIIVSLHDVVQSERVGTKFLLFANGQADLCDQLNAKMLEQTLGVQFEHQNPESPVGQLVPTFYRHTTD